MIRWIDHLVIAVNDLEEGIAAYEKLGLKLDRREESQALGIKQAFFSLGERGHLEIVEPLGPETPVGRSIARRGEGVHLVALAVDDIQQAAQDLKAKGVQLIEDGDQVFIHPRASKGVLFQLILRP